MTTKTIQQIIDDQFASIESLLADMEAGKPCDVPPELRALAEKIVAQSATAKELTGPKLEAWCDAVARWIVDEPDDEPPLFPMFQPVPPDKR